MASVRNEALDRATRRVVLMIDATYTLDPTSARLVRELVSADRFVGYAARELHQHGMDGAFRPSKRGSRSSSPAIRTCATSGASPSSCCRSAPICRSGSRLRG